MSKINNARKDFQVFRETQFYIFIPNSFETLYIFENFLKLSFPVKLCNELFKTHNFKLRWKKYIFILVVHH